MSANPAKPLLYLTLALYAVLQFLYMTATPLQDITLPDNLPANAPQTITVGIGPDEKEHFLYIRSLAETGKIPAPLPSMRKSPEEFVSYQAQHPPLFYGLAALVYKIVKPAGDRTLWYVLRGLCVLCGMGVIILLSKAAAIAFPDRPFVVLGTGAFVAFLPMFGHMTGNLSNEPLAMLFTAWAWLQMVRIVRSETAPTVKDGALLGLALGLAALTRLTAILWIPAAAIALIYAVRHHKGSVIPVIACAVVLVVLVAPYLIRNQMAYGSPILRTFYRPLLEGITLPQYLANPNQPIQPRGFPGQIVITPTYTLLWYVSTAWWPHWLVQFYLGVPPAVQGILVLLDLAILLMLFQHSSECRRGRRTPDAPGRVLLNMAGVSLAFCILALLQQQFFVDWNVVNSPGRYLVATVPATSLLFLFALSTLGEGRKTGNATAGKPLTPTVGIVLLLVVMFVFDLTGALLVRRFYTDNPRQDDVQNVQEIK